MTVNCRRSASGVLRLIFCVEALGAINDDPHSPQNLKRAGFSNPQFGQIFLSGIPHSPQNSVASGFSQPQLEQRIAQISVGIVLLSSIA
jgi:hypothetical protein